MFEQAFKNIDDVLWKGAGCTSEVDYTEQTCWLLFLKYLGGLKHEKSIATEEQIVSKPDDLSEDTQCPARLFERKFAALAALKKPLTHQAFTKEF